MSALEPNAHDTGKGGREGEARLQHCKRTYITKLTSNKIKRSLHGPSLHACTTHALLWEILEQAEAAVYTEIKALFKEKRLFALTVRPTSGTPSTIVSRPTCIWPVSWSQNSSHSDPHRGMECYKQGHLQHDPHSAMDIISNLQHQKLSFATTQWPRCSSWRLGFFAGHVSCKTRPYKLCHLDKCLNNSKWTLNARGSLWMMHAWLGAPTPNCLHVLTSSCRQFPSHWFVYERVHLCISLMSLRKRLQL